jgi:hypothetical protein
LNRIGNTDENDFEIAHQHQFFEILWFTKVSDNETHQIDFV